MRALFFEMESLLGDVLGMIFEYLGNDAWRLVATCKYMLQFRFKQILGSKSMHVIMAKEVSKKICKCGYRYKVKDCCKACYCDENKKDIGFCDVCKSLCDMDCMQDICSHGNGHKRACCNCIRKHHAKETMCDECHNVCDTCHYIINVDRDDYVGNVCPECFHKTAR